MVGFQCVSNDDCGNDEMECSPDLPSGICKGCSTDLNCPAGATCLAGFCLFDCMVDSDCSESMICNNNKCGKKSCMSNDDCTIGYLCSDTQRCERTECS